MRPNELYDRQISENNKRLFMKIKEDVQQEKIDLSCGYAWVRQKDVWERFCSKPWKDDATVSRALPPDPTQLASAGDGYIQEVYWPDVYIWAPEQFTGTSLRCPAGHRLSGNGWLDKPMARRVLDVDGSFYLMQKRYRCQCKDRCGCQSQIIQ